MKTTSMKKLLAVALLILTATAIQAKSWRINNDATKAPDFTDINAAMASAEVVAGDTLYLDPGTNLSAAQTVSKEVVVVGVGHGGNRPYTRATISGKVTVTAPNARLLGLYITGEVSINAQYVTLERCRIENIIYSSGTSCQYATFRQCYVTKTLNDDSAIKGQGKASNNSANWTIENSVVDIYVGKCFTDFYQATVQNNVLLTTKHWAYDEPALKSLGNSYIANNIIINRSVANKAIEDVSGTVTNNVLSQDYSSETNHVTNSTSTGVVFTGAFQSYALIENSPAAGYGTDGTDCGIFGGSYPYVADGLPQGHPYYEKAAISSRANNDKVNVSLKIKMQNE